MVPKKSSTHANSVIIVELRTVYHRLSRKVCSKLVDLTFAKILHLIKNRFSTVRQYGEVIVIESKTFELLSRELDSEFTEYAKRLIADKYRLVIASVTFNF